MQFNLLLSCPDKKPIPARVFNNMALSKKIQSREAVISFGKNLRDNPRGINE
jgi:hypothetical protein